MKTVQQFWPELVKLTSPWGLDNIQQREIQSLVLGGIEALPEMATDGAMEARPATVQRDSGFRFGAGSEKELVGVTIGGSV